MDGGLMITPEALRQRLAGDMARMLETVAAALNAARDGQWIADSEEPVREALAQLRQRAFEEGMQLKVEAAEGAFSPSGSRGVA